MTSFSLALIVLIVSVLVHESRVSAQCDAQAQCLKDIATLRNNVDIAARALNNKITSCTFACPAGFKQIPGVTKCIQIVQEGVNWGAGQDKCTALNAQASLLAIDSKAEYDFVTAELKALSDSGKTPPNGFWVGGVRAARTCGTRFMWETAAGSQSIVTFTDWATNQPDCYQGSEFCIHVVNVQGVFKWNDLICSASTWAVCQVTA